MHAHTYINTHTYMQAARDKEVEALTAEIETLSVSTDSARLEFEGRSTPLCVRSLCVREKMGEEERERL